MLVAHRGWTCKDTEANDQTLLRRMLHSHTRPLLKSTWVPGKGVPLARALPASLVEEEEDDEAVNDLDDSILQRPLRERRGLKEPG